MLATKHQYYQWNHHVAGKRVMTSSQSMLSYGPSEHLQQSAVEAAITGTYKLVLRCLHI